MVRSSIVCLALLTALLVSSAGAADDPPFPAKQPIEITVLFPAGSSADVTARLLADGMARRLGATVLVMNRPGAGGAIGYKFVAAQKPDGYALVWNSNSISTTHHSGQLPFDYKAFDAVARVLVEAPVLAVRADSRWRTLGDLLAEARARPRSISVGNSGAGSHTHISSVALFRAAGAEIVDVPFSAAQTVPSLLGGHVDALVQLPAALSAHVGEGSLRLLAALSSERDAALPEVPTAKEQGVEVALAAWRGIAVPHGTPRPVVAALETAIRATVGSRDFAEASAKLGVTPSFLPADAFDALIAREDEDLARLMKLIAVEK